MNVLQEAATDLWTRLLLAMREDGMIAEKITQAGGATTAVIVSMLQAQPGAAPQDSPWFKMNVTPTGGRKVVARDHNSVLYILHYDNNAKSWFKGKARVRADRFAEWRFVS